MLFKPKHLLFISILPGCSGDREAHTPPRTAGAHEKTSTERPVAGQCAKVESQVSKDAGRIVGAPTNQRIEFLEGRMKAIGGGFQLASVEEISAILNEAEFLKGSGGFIASYQNYLAEISDLSALTASLAPLKEAPWKTYFLDEIFSRSDLVTPENLSEILKVCKGAEEQKVLGESIAKK